MKKIYPLFISILCISCNANLEVTDTPEGAVELTRIQAVIASGRGDVQTRANAPSTPVVYLDDDISRYQFVDGDRMTFTAIRRTVSPIDRFNYSDVTFQSMGSGAWDRDKTTGSDNVQGSGIPARIYWSDATSEHTFIGYSLPKLASGAFDWEKESTYYKGTIGAVGETGQLSFNPASAETETITVDGEEVDIPISSLMRAEDILLTYDTELVADESIAYIKFYHGLSSVKVKVMLSEFYGSELDGYAIVCDMVLKDQPTIYKWAQAGYTTAAYSNTHSENNPRDMYLWDYVPDGVGTNAGKTFTFYGITVPQEEGYQEKDLQLTFNVKFPDPLKTDINELKNNPTTPIVWLTKSYTATIPSSTRVFFHAGQCTIINIKLNHRDEKITIGAQYTDWEFVPTPDEGSLKKNDTFLQSAPEFSNRPATGRVTIAADAEANEDDATWLYYKKENNAFVAGSDEGKVLLDIYGNTGTSDKPYTISTANQLLSFAYEVSNGRSFAGKYVKLDSDIVMQKKTDSKDINWIGIGTATNPFQGVFIGGGRKISMLKGKAFFANIGANARIERLSFVNPEVLTGIGVLAETNSGVICASKVDGSVKSTSASSVGALVGSNAGVIFACYHLGAVEGSGVVCGIAGTNTGSVFFSYNAGELVGPSSKYGISQSGAIEGCYYDNKQASAGVTDVTNVTGMSTGYLQAESFVTTLNDAIQNWTSGLPSADHLKSHRFLYSPAAYPSVE